MHDQPKLLMMLTELALRAGKVPHEAASQVPRPSRQGTFTMPIRANGYALIGMDLIININGQINLCECNGSNMAASSFGATDADMARAAHQVAAAQSRLEAFPRAVVLIAYAAGTGAVAEIMARSALVCSHIAATRPCVLLDASMPLGGQVSVVVDSVENIAEHVTAANGHFAYRGVPVASVANPNLLAELVRRDVLKRSGAHYCGATDLFHDGRFVDLVHDKAAQQRLARGTGITPLEWRECDSIEACLAAVGWFQQRGSASVGKMNGGSGGCGIEFFEPADDEASILRKLTRIERDARAKYRGQVERTMWPIRLFEFAQSTPYAVGENQHLWDMRVQCLIRPGFVDLSFCGIRVCPGPFKGKLDKEAVLSNVTGRAPDLLTTRSPLVDDHLPTQHLLRGGVDEAKLNEIVTACTHWCQAVWDSCDPKAEDSGQG